MARDFRDQLPDLVLSAAIGLFLLCLSPVAASPAPPHFQLQDSAGAVHTGGEWSGAPAIVLFFVTTDCPVANSYVPEMNRIEAAYAARGVRFYAVDADAAATVPAVATYAKDYGYRYPVLLDAQQVLVRLADATVTPQAVVLTPDGKVLYRGRVDNRVEDFGSSRPAATVHDLRNALDAVLAGRPVAVPFTKSIGCAITRTK